MSKIKLFFSTILLFTLALWLGYGLVFAWPLTWKDELNSYTKNIFKDSENLSKNKIILISNSDPKDFNVFWDCSLTWKYLNSNWKNHTFEIDLWDKNCSQRSLKIYFKNYYKTLTYDFNIISDYDLYYKYLDYSTEDLKNISAWIEKQLLVYKNNSEIEKSTFRLVEELNYLDSLFRKILENREKKYLLPVKWFKFSTRETKVPNSLRPYRNNYTDWIHHGWDFDAKIWTPVEALDDGIIIRVVRGFKNENFLKIKKSNVTEEDKLTNLDILRWNQIWIKTSKWDVAFYSHLDYIADWIKPWVVVKKWQLVWKVWITWVPEVGYKDSHLHLAIHKNPLDTSKAWSYSFLDIMAWPWYYKGQTARYMLEIQSKVFELN